MTAHARFNFKSIGELRGKIESLNVDINLRDDLSPLREKVDIAGRTAPNSIAILPMEGCDSDRDGSPSELVRRRYMRFAAGGAGLIWWEACAVVPEGRANELQMMLTRDNAGAFKNLVSAVNETAKAAFGHTPLHILQLTHSGRYSRPTGHTPAPIVPQRDPILDPGVGITDDSPICSDEYLASLVARYVESALLAKKAGFDGVDVKAVHRYLISELLASHTRGGKYGGSFENRSRLLLDIVREISRETGGDGFIVASRFNVFDAHPYPYGFGVDEHDFKKFAPEEPLLLVERLIEAGASLLSNSAGNPYYIYPQVTRPFDLSSMGIPVPDEHPLASIARLFDFTRLIQKGAGTVPVIGNGYTWLRQFFPQVASANLADGSCRMAGLGRMAFAYPDGPRDLLAKGALDPAKCCITCSKCTQMMRDHGVTGCPVRDSGVYAPLYKKYRAEADLRAKQTMGG